MRRILRFIDDLKKAAVDFPDQGNAIAWDTSMFSGATGMKLREYVQQLGWRTDLPTADGRYLVTVTRESQQGSVVQEATFSEGAWRWIERGSVIGDWETIHAWMELPEPFSVEIRGRKGWVNIERDGLPEVPGEYMFRWDDGSMAVREMPDRFTPSQTPTHWRCLPEQPWTEDAE